jgi:SPP1 family predicted phage head-tail adaptor
MPTSIGQLNRRIAIQQQTTTQDEYGQPQQTWSTVYSCWASNDVQQSQLIYSTAEFIEKVTHRITIRWTHSLVLQPNMRIVYTEPPTNVAHTYNIEALVNPMQGNVWLTVLCYELDGNE